MRDGRKRRLTKELGQLLALVKTTTGERKYVGFPLRFFQDPPSDPWSMVRISLHSPIQHMAALASEESIELVEMSRYPEMNNRKSDGLERALEYLTNGESEEDQADEEYGEGIKEMLKAKNEA